MVNKEKHMDVRGENADNNFVRRIVREGSVSLEIGSDSLIVVVNLEAA